MSENEGLPNGDGRGDKKEQILHALEVVYDPRSLNETRFKATNFLEHIRSDNDAPFFGFGLAKSTEQSGIVRHFGLSLIDYAIRFRWSSYGDEEARTLREWVLGLAHGSVPDDPPFVTNKIAELWVEIAKRAWGLDWVNMDEALVQMWSGTTAQKEMALVILSILSEEIFGVDDAIVGLRGNDLKRVCVDIFTPVDVLGQQFPNRESTLNVRHGSEGWLGRMAEGLNSCVNDGRVDAGLYSLTLKLLSTFRSVVTWIVPNALVTTKSLLPIFLCLKVSDVQIQLVGSLARSLKYW